MLTGLDLVFFAACLVGVMAVGLLAGRRRETSEEYFLASRSLPWWGVAGSVFGTNVSANHLVGMLGVGFSIGFAQSHFELGAAFALLALAYLLLPVYSKLRVFTLSAYLAGRYDERTAILYSTTTLLLIIVQMTALFYIGSRSMNLLLEDSAFELGYVGGIAALAVITGVYTIVGGLRAVVWTDVLQSMLLLAAGALVAVATFSQPEIGGFSGLLARDAALPAAEQRMHLYLPPSHPDLPWTGVFTGLMALHLSFWGTNQYIVQRTLAARSPEQARVGILVGGFLKLFVPFFSIAGGVAAAQLFRARMEAVTVAPDEAFPVLMALVLPAGLGLMGLVAAGLLGAILSTIDSMLNSAATLVAFDLYQKHWRPDAEDAELVRTGRGVVVALVVASALMAATTFDPESRGNFFLDVSRRISYLTPGLMVSFVVGMFWSRATARGAVAAILSAPLLGVAFEWGYAALADQTGMASVFGNELNFMHRTFLTVLACVGVHAGVSRTEPRDPGASAYLFTTCTGASREQLGRILASALLYVSGNGALALCLAAGALTPAVAGAIGAAFTFAVFADYTQRAQRRESPRTSALRDDRLLAGVLAAGTTFVLLFFY
jgi:SSS family solute:Na+ symporter